MMVVNDFCNMIFLNQSNASFQFDIPNQLRGRIMSVYVLLNQDTTPIGSLYVGGVMDVFTGLRGFPACGFLALLLLVPVLFINRELVGQWLITENTSKLTYGIIYKIEIKIVISLMS